MWRKRTINLLTESDNQPKGNHPVYYLLNLTGQTVMLDKQIRSDKLHSKQ